MSEGASSKVLGGEGPSSTLLTTSLSGGPGTQVQGPLIPNTPAAAAPVATTSVPVLGISPNLDCGPLDENGNATIVSSTSQSSPPSSPHDQQHHNLLPRVIYDFNSKSGKIEARLRLWLPGGAGRAQLLAPVLPTSTGSGNSQASSVASSSASDLTTEEDNERLMEEDDEKEENLRGNPLIGTSLAQTLRRALHVDHEQHHDLGETSEIGSLQTPGYVPVQHFESLELDISSTETCRKSNTARSIFPSILIVHSYNYSPLLSKDFLCNSNVHTPNSRENCKNCRGRLVTQQDRIPR